MLWGVVTEFGVEFTVDFVVEFCVNVIELILGIRVLCLFTFHGLSSLYSNFTKFSCVLVVTLILVLLTLTRFLPPLHPYILILTPIFIIILILLWNWYRVTLPTLRKWYRMITSTFCTIWERDWMITLAFRKRSWILTEVA